MFNLSSFSCLFLIFSSVVAQFGNMLGGFPYNSMMMNPMGMYGSGLDYSAMSGYGLYNSYPYNMMGSYGMNGMSGMGAMSGMSGMTGMTGMNNYNSLLGNYGFGGYGMYGMGLDFGQSMNTNTMSSGVINSGNNLRKRISSTSTKYSSNQQGCSYSNSGGCDGGSSGWLKKKA